MEKQPQRPDQKDPEEEGSAAKQPQPPDPDSNRDPEEEGSSGRPER